MLAVFVFVIAITIVFVVKDKSWLTARQIDYLVLCWAVHRLSGIVSAANAAYSAPELAHQLVDSRCKALFTCLPSLPSALEAAEKAGIPKSRVYIIDLPAEFTGSAKTPAGFKTLEQFITEGCSLPPVERAKWGPGQAAKQTAFLCYSSGTSGLPVFILDLSECSCIDSRLTVLMYRKA